MKTTLYLIVVVTLLCLSPDASGQSPSPASAKDQCTTQWIPLERRYERRWDEDEAGRKAIAALVHESEKACVDACEQGAASACLKLAWLYQSDDGCPEAIGLSTRPELLRCSDEDNIEITKDDHIQVAYEHGQLLLKEHCVGGDPVACNRLADLYIYLGDGKLPGGSVSAAAELFDWSCRKENVIACNKLADLYTEGNGVAKNPIRAEVLSGRAQTLFGRQQILINTPRCADNDMNACYELGLVYVDGIGVTKEPAHAWQLFDRACANGHALGCIELARLHLIESDGKSGNAVALKLYQKACDLGNTCGCDNFQLMVEGSPYSYLCGVNFTNGHSDIFGFDD